MSKRKLLEKIDQLEKRIQALEARPLFAVSHPPITIPTPEVDPMRITWGMEDRQ